MVQKRDISLQMAHYLVGGLDATVKIHPQFNAFFIIEGSEKEVLEKKIIAAQEADNMKMPSPSKPAVHDANKTPSDNTSSKLNFLSDVFFLLFFSFYHFKNYFP